MIREYAESDLQFVKKLWAENPVGGKDSYYYDSPPFCKKGYKLFVVESGGMPVGTFSLCLDLNGKAFYVSDVVLEKAYRGRFVAIDAIIEGLNKELTDEIQFLTAAQPYDNRNSRFLIHPNYSRVLYETPFEMFYLPALGGSEPEITSNLAEVCDFVNSFYRGHALFHPVTPDDLASRKDFTIAVERVNGKIVACAGIWDQRSIRRLMLVSPPAGTRAAMWFTKLLNKNLQIAKNNGVSELVAHIITEPAFIPGHEKQFHRLMGNLGWKRNAHCFQIAAHALCPIGSEIKKRVHIRFVSRLLIYQYSARQNAQLPKIEGPVYHDYSLV